MEQRVAWDDLPEPLEQAIEARTGPPSAHRRVVTQAREAAVAPLVRGISPALLWDEIAQSSTSAWTAKMAQAAKSWAACRQAR